MASVWDRSVSIVGRVAGRRWTRVLGSSPLHRQGEPPGVVDQVAEVA
jgi:hypothetical protein